MFYCLYALAEKYDVDFVKSGYKQFVTNETRNIINYENARVLLDEYIKSSPSVDSKVAEELERIKEQMKK